MKEIIKENYVVQIVSDKFGGYDDSQFLKKVWNMPEEELPEIIERAKSDLKWLNNMGRMKNPISAFYRKDAHWVRSRIKWLGQIIKSKKKEPNYVPDHYKINSVNEIRGIIRECFREILMEQYASEGYVTAVRGQDYATINGMAYQLKECGVESKMDYKKGSHRLLVRRDQIPRTIEMLENSVDEVSSVLAERLKKKYQSE